MTKYVLGTSRGELERLALQQQVWGGVTEAFLDRVGVARGARVLDLGCGPGFVTRSLRERVGDLGEVVALDESEAWIDHLGRTAREHGWRNVRAIRARIEEAELAPGHFDLVFARWVLGFLPEADAVVARLARALRPGGVLAVQDYNHEGISCFPESEGFRAVIRATRALYASRGGDTWIAGRLPRWFADASLEVCDYRPNLLCGGPESPACRWMDAFFPAHVDGMVAEGFLSADERTLFLREWSERLADPCATFFTPIVVDAAARRAPH